MRCLPIIVLVTLTACRETFPTYSEPFEAKNLLMISVDTYRRDYMTRYGSARGLTPFMDELAERSLVLDDHVSCSDWTLPSVLCVGAGRYEPAYGFVSRLQPTYREVVPEHTSLAGWLGEQGFYSILMSSNSWLEGDWNHDGGYDYAEHAGTDDGRRVWELGRNKLFEAQEEGLVGEDRWFLHIHLKEPHSPYNPPAEYLEGLDDLPPIDYDLTTQDGHDAARFSLQSMDEAEREAVLAHLLLRYDGEMAYEDDILKDIWNDANARGLLKNTVVSLWTDHGEQEYERENWGHAFQLYQEEAGAVALFWHPDIEPEAWTGPTDHIDIAPTLLQMFDLAVPDEVEGQPLGQAPADRTLFAITVARLGPLLQATRAGMRMQYDYNGGTLEVYDLPGDPGEDHDLYDPFDPEQTTLWEELSAWADQIEPLMQEYPRVEPER